MNGLLFQNAANKNILEKKKLLYFSLHLKFFFIICYSLFIYFAVRFFLIFKRKYI